MSQYFVAADIGGTTIKCAIINEYGKIEKEFAVPTIVDKNNLNSNAFLKKLKEQIKLELNELSLSLQDDILSIYLTVPGKYNHKNQVIKLAPNMNLKEYSIDKEAKEVFPNQNIFCLNDAEAAVLGQSRISREENVVLYILGTGVGASVTTKSKLIFEEKEDGIFSMGEFGHRSEKDTRKYSEEECGCAQKGCLETVASALRINKRIRENHEYLKETEIFELNKFKKENKLEEFNTFVLNEFVKDTKEGDFRFSIFKKILKPAMSALAQSMTDLCLRNPELENHSFYIAGGGAKIDERFLDILKEELKICNPELNLKVDISENPDKLALNGLIGSMLEEQNKIEQEETDALSF